MRTTILFVIACAITFSSTDAIAQRRHHKPVANTTNAAKTSADLKQGRDHVATQIKVLTRFLYLFGGVARTAESANAASANPTNSNPANASPANAGPANKDTTTIHDGRAASVAAENKQSRSKIVESFNEVRDGLDKLETEFSSNTTLRSYYAYIIGVSGIADTAKSQAAANHLDQAGTTLLKAVDRLTDALAAMR